MKTKKFFHILSLILTFSVVFISCEKEESGEQITEEDIALAEDDALADALFNDIWDAVENAERIVDDRLFNARKTSSVIVPDSCPTISVDHPDTTFWPKVITIDYGDTNCEGFYGQTRRGKILITVTGRYRHEGSVKTVTLEGYYINEVHIEGIKTITNNGKNDNGNFIFTVELEGGKVTATNGISIEREFLRIREWIAGVETPNRWDDVYLITGSANGVNFMGEEYTRTILIPLEWAASCRFIKSGTVESVISDRSPVILDYGDGECDNEATVTKDGKTRIILLKYNPRPKIR
ncbi:MAG: hypothetical protein JSV24_06210 [Bacteroidales bacterium]|nr:MAG: hypothetical protein JSV24_06210 [Bacteroidales bacterium]